jgi:Mn-dependent DtxR family transcriptional regulator
MKLTRRQEEFVKILIELVWEFDGPVHYSLLAERLGINPLTAYDMLCLLEEKGFVASAYQLPTDKSGPGRAERVFYPGRMAQTYKKRIVGESGGVRPEGEALKEYVLEKLRQGGLPDSDNELVEQLMARLLPAGQGDVRYCVEVMTIAALRLQHNEGRQFVLELLPTILPGEQGARQANLCLLGGFVFGILAQQCAPGQEWMAKLREHLQGYIDAVMQMDSKDQDRLAAHLISMFAALGENR